MTNEIEQLKKLLTAFIKAQGFEVKKIVDWGENKIQMHHPETYHDVGRVLKKDSIGVFLVDDDCAYTSVLITPIVDYKVHRVKVTGKPHIGLDPAKPGEDRTVAADDNMNVYTDTEKVAKDVVKDDTILLPCPFCGGAPRFEGVHSHMMHGTQYCIMCPECNTKGSYSNRKKDVTELWNKRANGDKTPPV